MIEKAKNRLLIVESDAVLRSSLHDYFADHHCLVMSIASEKNIATTLLKTPINVIVLSLTASNRDVLCLLEWLTHYYPHTQLIVTVKEKWADADERVQLLEKGVTDIVITPFQPKELLLRINNALLLPVASAKHYQTGDLRLYTNSYCVIKAGKKIPLTSLETEMLKLLYLNIDCVVTRDAITQQLYGLEHHPLNRSIDIHINKIRKKIEDNPSKPNYIRTVRGKGYYLKSSSFLPNNSAPLAAHHALH